MWLDQWWHVLGYTPATNILGHLNHNKHLGDTFKIIAVTSGNTRSAFKIKATWGPLVKTLVKMNFADFLIRHCVKTTLLCNVLSLFLCYVPLGLPSVSFYYFVTCELGVISARTILDECLENNMSCTRDQGTNIGTKIKQYQDNRSRISQRSFNFHCYTYKKGIRLLINWPPASQKPF